MSISLSPMRIFCLATVLASAVTLIAWLAYRMNAPDVSALLIVNEYDASAPVTYGHFKDADPATYQLARKIERKEPINAMDVADLPEGALNARYQYEITLLFFALYQQNLQALDVLLGNGADPHMTDRSEYSGRDFTYFAGAMITNPVSLGNEFRIELISLYLKHGGDPNHRLPGRSQMPFFYYVALMHNYDGVEMLLEAGADPLIGDRQGGAVVAHMLAHRNDERSYELTRHIVCHGYFDRTDTESVRGMLRSLSNKREKSQKLAMRILRYHPDFDESDYSVKDIFGGETPWEEISNTSDETLCAEKYPYVIY